MLQWLIARANRVYEWFGSLYDRGREVVLMVQLWLWDYAMLAYSWSRDWAFQRIQNVRGYAVSLYWQARYWIQRTRDEIRSWALGKVNEAIAHAVSLYWQARYWIQRTRDEIISTASSWFDLAKQYALNLFQDAINKLDKFKATVIPQFEFLNTLKDVFTKENLDRFLDLIQTGYQTVSSFAKNPVGFSVGMLKPFILDFLGWVLAYALGTENAELPPMPDFTSNYTDPEIPPNNPPGTYPDPSSGGGISTRFGDAPKWLSALVQQYFPENAWRSACELCYMESGWNASAVNDTRHLGGGQCGVPYQHPVGITARTEYSVGLFQINICAHGGSFEQWSDPQNNVAYASQIYQSSGWQPWTYSAGKLGLL